LVNSEPDLRAAVGNQTTEGAIMARRRSTEHEAAERSARQFSSVASGTSEFWVESQARVFEHFDEVARRWLDHRREALDATRRSFEEMRGTDNVGELMRVQQEWVFGSLQRLAADMSELSAAAFNVAQAAATQMGKTAERTAGGMERAGYEMMSAAGSKPNNSAAK
jgi:Phasin protein